MNKFFFELLQVAIGNRQALTSRPTDEEWEFLYHECEKHALLGIAFCGVERLPKEQFPSFDVAAEWVHDAQVAKERNEKLNAECEALTKQLEHDGLWCCILKGQSNLVNYYEHLRDYRTAGDIDVWCVPMSNGKTGNFLKYKGERGVIEYALRSARLAGKSVQEVRYHHVDLEGVYPVDVEIHHRPSFMCSPLRNRRLKNWYKRFKQVNEIADIDGRTFPVPTTSFNAIYQLTHIYRHLFDEGIGLRQILDYYFVLRRLHIEQGEHSDRTQSIAMWEDSLGRSVLSNDAIMNELKQLGMKKFASAIMYVLQTVFAMPDEYLICKPNEKEGKFLLSEIMQAGNFGKYDERIKRVEGSYMKIQCNHAIEKWKHNLRLIAHYPEEVLWEPIFRVYHFVWRRCELWRV